jgi:hypothetical protein
VIADDGTVRLSDTRYLLASLDPGQVTATDLLTTVRAHWQIENCLFFVKDRWWDEDRHWTRRPGVADWLTNLTSAATAVLRLLGPPDLPLRGRADQIAWQPHHGLAILNSA